MAAGGVHDAVMYRTACYATCTVLLGVHDALMHRTACYATCTVLLGVHDAVMYRTACLQLHISTVHVAWHATYTPMACNMCIVKLAFGLLEARHEKLYCLGATEVETLLEEVPYPSLDRDTDRDSDQTQRD